MKEPTLQDILEEGIRYYAQRWDSVNFLMDKMTEPNNNNGLTLLQVLDKGVQHYVRRAHEEYERIKRMEEKTRKPAEPMRNITGINLPDSSEGRRYE